MRVRSADLGTLWESLKVKFEEQQRELPLRWLLFYKAVHWMLSRGVLR